MFGKGKGIFRGKRHFRGRHKHKCLGRGQKIPLSNAAVGSRHCVIMNPDKKTVEMGIFSGSIITVHKNELSDQNIVVGVGNSRYIIPKTIAAEIIIQ